MKKVFYCLAAAMFLVSCSKKNDANNISGLENGRIAPTGFDYKTTSPVSFDINLRTNTEAAISGIPVEIFAYRSGSLIGQVGTVVTDNVGNAKTTISVPAYLDSFVITPKIVGVLSNVIVYKSAGNMVKCTLGGKAGYSGNVAGTFATANRMGTVTNGSGITRGAVSVFDINGVSTNTAFTYLGTADKLGRPNYLEATGDIISADFLKAVNYSLPESRNLSTSPNGLAMLNSNATTGIELKVKTEVFVTFVSSITANKNSLGFYKYATNNPPTSLADIKEITFVFPNSKLAGSGNAGGGNLKSGDKVKIGTIGADTTIGFVLYANGWDSKAAGVNVNTASTAFFTDSYLNPEPDSKLKKHSVLLDYFDATQNKDFFVVGFDDSRRDAAWCDHDFNDCLYYVSTTEVKSVNVTNVTPTAVPKDSDKDGVDDVLDAYPLDASKAYDTYYPTLSGWGTLAFEDNWPAQGDYDLNDLVVKYRYKLTSNSKNHLVEMAATFVPVASGATYNNGFGVELPFSSAVVSSVTGQKLSGSYIKLNTNNTEANQTKAVIIPFDGVKSVLNNPSGNIFVNTDNNLPKVSGDTISIKVVLGTPQSNIDYGSFNPFLISNQRRGSEVHLPNFKPTSLADAALIGTNADASNATSGIYYVTTKNYPFALNFAEDFNYPVEQAPINDAYLRFFDWAASGGKLYTDWYSNTVSGYQNAAKIYNK